MCLGPRPFDLGIARQGRESCCQKRVLDDTFDPAFWKQLSFFALVKPQGDILPVRTVYSDTGKTQNIGLNYLSSEKPIWYAGAGFDRKQDSDRQNSSYS